MTINTSYFNSANSKFGTTFVYFSRNIINDSSVRDSLNSFIK